MRPDRFTKGLERLETGEAVTLVDEHGKRLASALIDRDNEVCARVFDRRPDQPFDPKAAIAKAWQARASLHADPATNCYRIVHGEADGLPGVRVERYGPAVIVLLRAPCARPALDAVCACLREQLPDAPIAIREHLDGKQGGTQGWKEKLDPETVIEGLELGVRLQLQPFKSLATGIYVDQRATRAWLRPLAVGKSALNLFAYTGLFSVSLLAAGASKAIDVDLSAPALQRARSNAELNGVADRHETVHGDCLEFVGRTKSAFDIIVVDPPTSAQGADGWLNRRDYPALMRAVLPKLSAGGLLIACSNTLGAKQFDLMPMLRAAARESEITFRPEQPPTLGIDIPQLPGFPEGRPYQLVCMRRSER